MTENYTKSIFNGQVQWSKNKNNEWSSLMYTDFSLLLNSGVSIVWWYDNGNPPLILSIQKSGVLAIDIDKYRSNELVVSYLNPLVTWAYIPSQYLNGVEKYLYDHYKPVIKQSLPKIDPIQVNLPIL